MASSLVLNHMRALRKLDFLSNAWFIYAPERNMAHEAGFIYKDVRDEYRVLPLCEKDHGDPGIWTSRPRKVEYAISARQHIKDGSVKLLNKIVVSNVQLRENTRAKITVDKLFEQLYLYRQIDSETLDPNSMLRTGVSGVVNKNGRKDSSIKDDLAFTFTMNMGVCDRIYGKEYKNLDYSKFFPGF